MASLLLAVIYLAFISLGLPDSLVGSAWPVMHAELGVPVSYAGIVTMVIAGGTIISSLMSDRLTKKLGAGLVTSFSVLLTAAALFGFSISGAFWQLCLWAIPYGLGAGAIDAALNNYVALHYASRHMNWLHCFWGVGASISPYIMSACLTGGLGWNSGYRAVSIIQIILTAILFLSLPLWSRSGAAADGGARPEPLRIADAVRIKGVPQVLAAFFAYCALESTTGLWASSYLVQHRGVDAVVAARFASFFYLGITAGRFLCGFISDRLGDRRMILLGSLTALFGAALIAVPFTSDVFALAGLIVAGIGCAPVYPAIIHSTPDNFGRDRSQAIIGMQMASAYIGSTFMPPLFGLLASRIDISLYPFYLLLFVALLFIMSRMMFRSVDAAKAAHGSVSA